MAVIRQKICEILEGGMQRRWDSTVEIGPSAITRPDRASRTNSLTDTFSASE
jgi:hypothetical protein